MVWMDPVTVQFYKFPRVPHWGFAGYLLGRDEYGRWVGRTVASR
jgi:hypothetical protein